MMNAMISLHMILLLMIISHVNTLDINTNTIILFLFNIMEENCGDGSELNKRISPALSQAIFTQKGNRILFAANFGDCTKSSSPLAISYLEKQYPEVEFVDTTKLVSEKTVKFLIDSKPLDTNSNTNSNASPNDNRDNSNRDPKERLWLLSSVKYFLIEDIMKNKGLNHVIYNSIDNFLYANIDRSMLLALQSRYQKLATGTIAENEHLGMEFLWVNGISSITTLTDFLMTMGTQSLELLTYREEFQSANITSILRSSVFKNQWDRYLHWTRKWGCCKRGSTYLRDSRGNGIRPGAVNEITLLSFYHYAYPNELEFFPFALKYDFITEQRRERFEIEERARHGTAMGEYMAGGQHAGQSLGRGVVDPGGFGILATRYTVHHPKRVDLQQMVGRYFKLTNCEMKFECSNITTSVLYDPNPTISSSSSSLPPSCWTIPFLTCPGQEPAPLINMRVPLHRAIENYKNHVNVATKFKGMKTLSSQGVFWVLSSSSSL